LDFGVDPLMPSPSYLLRLHPKFGYRKPWTQWPDFNQPISQRGGIGYCIDVGFSLWEWICSWSHWNLWAFPCRCGKIYEWVKKIVLSLLSIFPNCKRSRHWIVNMVRTDPIPWNSFFAPFQINLSASFSIQHYKGDRYFSCLRCKLRCVCLV